MGDELNSTSSGFPSHEQITSATIVADSAYYYLRMQAGDPIQKWDGLFFFCMNHSHVGNMAPFCQPSMVCANRTTTPFPGLVHSVQVYIGQF